MIKHPDREHYYAAMKREIDIIETRHTWTLVHQDKLPNNQQILPVRWVFTTKPPKYKARLVVRGDL